MCPTNLTLLLIAALFSGCAATQQHPANAQALYRREVNQKSPWEKGLVMDFEELRRDEKTSAVRVTFKSGGSVPSSMFIMRGFYDIAQARHTPYFIKLKEWKEPDGGWMYIVGYSRDKNVDPQRYFGLREPLPKDEEHEFMATKAFDILFKAKQ